MKIPFSKILKFYLLGIDFLGVKTIYYIKSQSLEVEECVSCACNERKIMEKLRKKDLFNAIVAHLLYIHTMINGNTTNLNDFNNMKYT